MKYVKMIVTAKDSGERLSEKEDLLLLSRVLGEVAELEIDPSITYQSIVGFGGAFTEAAAYTLSRVSDEKRAEVIRSYFDPMEGLGYSIGRVHIHSCDFALGNYTYVEDNDTELATFDISHDQQWVLPLIKDAMKVKGGEFTMLASPWSSPAWMKTNGEMNNGG